MVRTRHRLGRIVIGLLVSGLLGCGGPDSIGARRPPAPATPAGTLTPTPAPDGRYVCGGGETSAGRRFTILCDDSTFGVWVLVEGEEEVYLGATYPCLPIRVNGVDEYAGAPGLVHVRWRLDGICKNPSGHGYLAFAPGNAATMLLWGQVEYYRGVGGLILATYDLDYASPTLSITEREMTGNAYSDWDADGYCRATQVRLARSYAVDSGGSTLLTCEKSQRAASFWSATPVACSPAIHELLDRAPWEPVDMPPEEAEGRCRALGGGLY